MYISKASFNKQFPIMTVFLEDGVYSWTSYAYFVNLVNDLFVNMITNLPRNVIALFKLDLCFKRKCRAVIKFSIKFTLIWLVFLRIP